MIQAFSTYLNSQNSHSNMRVARILAAIVFVKVPTHSILRTMVAGHSSVADMSCSLRHYSLRPWVVVALILLKLVDYLT
jgi:hypothetical protein